MNIAEKAFVKLYEREPFRDVDVTYSKRFKPYNGNIHYNNKKAEVRLSQEWERISEDIQIGFIQKLYMKAFEDEPKTKYVKLYEHFIDNLNTYATVEESDEVLEESFERVRNKYFDEGIEKPNMKWGPKAYRKLGHYEFKTDTIVISEIFKQNTTLLDYLMFHELLHKKHGIERKEKQNRYHTKAFREDEKAFDVEDIEEKLQTFVARKKLGEKVHDVF